MGNRGPIIGKQHFGVWEKYTNTKELDVAFADKSITSAPEEDEREAPNFVSEKETQAYRKGIMDDFKWDEQRLLLFENIFTHSGVTIKNPDVELRICEVLDDNPEIDEVFTRLDMKVDEVVALLEDALPGYRSFCIEKRRKMQAEAAGLDHNTP